ncbi:MAG: VacJ family lipoprotein, partial [Methylococcaceae bacterium]|nr:VacJ family lipoprotein [Methylococcaceae bacterium]
MTIQQKMARYLPVFAVLFWLSGCATTTTPDPRDPWEGWNRGVQSFNDTADDYVVKPVAEGYQWITPSFVDQGVTNFFNNIGDITVTINDFLQFKFGQGSEDFTRFLINTTLGVVGFVDVGTMLEFERHNEDFGQTLGAWGMPTGPYLVLPLLGPSTPREAFGLVG